MMHFSARLAGLWVASVSIWRVAGSVLETNILTITSWFPLCRQTRSAFSHLTKKNPPECCRSNLYQISVLGFPLTYGPTARACQTRRSFGNSANFSACLSEDYER